MKPLKEPPAARTSKDAVELLRAWIVDKGLQCSLSLEHFGDQEAIFWGILLSDIARHVAEGLFKAQGIPAEESLRIIRAHFDQEIYSPTAPTSGVFEKPQ